MPFYFHKTWWVAGGGNEAGDKTYIRIHVSLPQQKLNVCLTYIHMFEYMPVYTPDISTGSRYLYPGISTASTCLYPDISSGSRYLYLDISAGSRYLYLDMPVYTPVYTPDISTGSRYLYPDIFTGSRYLYPDVSTGSTCPYPDISSGSRYLYWGVKISRHIFDSISLSPS